MLSPTVWIKLSQLQLWLKSKNWNRQGLSVGLIALGPHLYIWFKNLIGPVTRKDWYPLPNIRDFTNNLRGCKFFYRLDLVKGYNQVPMSEADICKTAIVTPFGLFEFLYMPFGLKNAAQTFQLLMDMIFRGLPFVSSTWMMYQLLVGTGSFTLSISELSWSSWCRTDWC